MNTFQERLKFGHDAEDVFEMALQQQIFPNKGYKRFTFEMLRDKYGWNVTECQQYTKVHGDFHVTLPDDKKMFFDVKGTEKISETSLMEAKEGLVFAMNMHVSRDHCFFLMKNDMLVKAIQDNSKEVKLPGNGDKGYAIYAAMEFPGIRLWKELPRKILSLKKRLRKEEVKRKEREALLATLAP